MTDVVTDERCVVVSGKSATDYARAVVHPDQASADAYIEELNLAAPWQNHYAVPYAEFASAADAVPSDPAAS